MADENKKSRADDIFDVLQDIDSDKSQSPVADDVIGKNADFEEKDEKDKYFDELLDILSQPKQEPEAEEETNRCSIDCDNEIPDSIFSHLSDDICDRAMPVGSENESHFTEQENEEPEALEEQIEEPKKKGFWRTLWKILKKIKARKN